MEIRRIFTNKHGKLWAVCYPEDRKGSKWIDIFRVLMNKWNDTQYLIEFFNDHEEELNDIFWGGMSVDEAIDKVIDECNDFETELYHIENQFPGSEKPSLSSIFLPLHENIYSLNFKNENFRKAKPDFNKPILRFYAIELEDGTFIITGGAIKLSRDMRSEIFEKEMKKLQMVKNFLDVEGISDEKGLTE